MCAIAAGRRGRRVIILDHAVVLGEKIRISGGGRCNFTNLGAGPANYLSANPHFCKSALARFTPHDFLAMAERHRIAWTEKAAGQLFCRDGAQDVIDMLLAECDAAGVAIRTGCAVRGVRAEASDSGRFAVSTATDTIACESVVVATGGLSIPRIGASDFGHRLAQRFGLPLVPTRPALVPLTFPPEDRDFCAALSGISLDAEIWCGKQRFRDALLFTHRGLSGPAILQISSYWRPGEAIAIDLLPERRAAQMLTEDAGKQLLSNWLAHHLPKRLAQAWVARNADDRPLLEFGRKRLTAIGEALNRWPLTPAGTEGYGKAEVTLGGVDTAAVSSATMEAKAVPGLFFIGEVLDVTGHLGGYNFQWAWASGHAAGQAV